MAVIVQKFGGTSVADLERIRNVAEYVQEEVKHGNQVVVVVSAMAGVTNQLDGWAHEVSSLSDDHSQREYDAIVATGEQVTSGLLSLTLQSLGVAAQSLQAGHLPLKVDHCHMKARIDAVDTSAITEVLNAGQVVVVPGFQGVTDDGFIATLGRGGSDTTAVAIAAALEADRCDIYTDVDGVYTTDPRLVPAARRLNKVGYEEVLEMASLGAKVLQTRSVEMAMKYKVPVQVRSSFSNTPGTLLVEEEEVMERRMITGITYDRNDVQCTLVDVENIPGVAAHIFGPLADANINVDVIVQNISEDGKQTNVTFTVPQADAALAKETLEKEQSEGRLSFKSLLQDDGIAKVSVIGVGMRSHAGLAQTMFSTLAENGVNIGVISTSEIKISVLIDEEHLEKALTALHTAYGLDKKADA